MISSFDEEPDKETLFVKYQGIAFQIIENTSKMNFAVFMNKMSSDLETFIKKFSDPNNFSKKQGGTEINSDEHLYIKKLFIAWKISKGLRILK
jgi:hypothetical protein